MTIGNGALGLGGVSPGQGNWLAQINADLAQLQDINDLRRVLVSGEALTAGECVGIENGDGRMYKADHTAAAGVDDYLWNVYGVTATTVASAGENIIVILRGPITISGHGFPVGAPIYLNASVPGQLTNLGTSGRLIGIVEDADTIFLDCPRSWAAS